MLTEGITPLVACLTRHYFWVQEEEEEVFLTWVTSDQARRSLHVF